MDELVKTINVSHRARNKALVDLQIFDSKYGNYIQYEEDGPARYYFDIKCIKEGLRSFYNTEYYGFSAVTPEYENAFKTFYLFWREILTNDIDIKVIQYPNNRYITITFDEMNPELIKLILKYF